MTLGQDEAFARIRLIRTPDIGPVRFRLLLERFGSAEAALMALPDAPAPEAGISAEIKAVKRAGARYLFLDSPDYPPLLRELESAPPVLIVRGDAALAQRPAIAMVGARNASAAAVKLARDFAGALAEAGFVIVSGMARGIDGAAHMGALAQGSGTTIGVIASGIDIAYPPEHASLQERVAREALLIAEQPMGAEPLARNFPRRNRIIAGLASATLVVEAAPKSGSLITARIAAEAGREVMAIPGSPLEPRAQGANELIREGATLVQRVEDVIEAISGLSGGIFAPPKMPVPAPMPTAEPAPAPREPAELANLLTTAPVAVDELIRQSGQSPSAVQMALLDLELEGRLARHAGGRVSLA